MKNALVPMALVFLLSACGGDMQQSPTAEVPKTAKAEPVVPVNRPAARPAPAGQKGVDILASEGVTFDFPYAINYDIMDTSSKGTPRHRVLVEVLGGNFEESVQKFTKSLTAMGYKKAGDKTKNGRMEQVYKQSGRPTYYLRIQPAEVGPELKNKRALGSIHVMWSQPR